MAYPIPAPVYAQIHPGMPDSIENVFTLQIHSLQPPSAGSSSMVDQIMPETLVVVKTFNDEIVPAVCEGVEIDQLKLSHIARKGKGSIYEWHTPGIFRNSVLRNTTQDHPVHDQTSAIGVLGHFHCKDYWEGQSKVAGDLAVIVQVFRPQDFHRDTHRVVIEDRNVETYALTIRCSDKVASRGFNLDNAHLNTYIPLIRRVYELLDRALPAASRVVDLAEHGVDRIIVDTTTGDIVYTPYTGDDIDVLAHPATRLVITTVGRFCDYVKPTESAGVYIKRVVRRPTRRVQLDVNVTSVVVGAELGLLSVVALGSQGIPLTGGLLPYYATIPAPMITAISTHQCYKFIVDAKLADNLTIRNMRASAGHEQDTLLTALRLAYFSKVQTIPNSKKFTDLWGAFPTVAGDGPYTLVRHALAIQTIVRTLK